MTRRSRLWALLALIQLWLAAALAHEVRPAYLQLRQVDADTYDVLWKVPALGEEQRLALYIAFTPETVTVGKPRTTFLNNALLQQWRVRRAGGLDGTPMRIDGQQSGSPTCWCGWSGWMAGPRPFA